MDTVDGCQVPTTAMGFRRWLLFEARFHRLVSSDLDAEIERCAAPRRRNTRLCGTLRSARAPQCLYYRRFCVRRARTWPNFSLRSPGAVGNRFARVKESQTRICSLLVFRVLWCTGICWCMTVNTFLVSTCVSSWTCLLDKLCFRVLILTKQLWTSLDFEKPGVSFFIFHIITMTAINRFEYYSFVQWGRSLQTFLSSVIFKLANKDYN